MRRRLWSHSVLDLLSQPWIISHPKCFSLNVRKRRLSVMHITVHYAPPPHPSARTYSVLLPAALTVGSHPVQLFAVGQWAPPPFPTLEAACQGVAYPLQGGFYGRLNETCFACPSGASCAGYVGSPLTTAADFTNRYPYPVAVPGFFNLNGDMATACPPGNAVSGRDVCIVGCTPTTACVGRNLCANGYVSKAPLFRCGYCASGYYPTGNTCAPCPSSPASIFVVFVLAVVFGAAAGKPFRKNCNICCLYLNRPTPLQLISLIKRASILPLYQ